MKTTKSLFCLIAICAAIFSCSTKKDPGAAVCYPYTITYSGGSISVTTYAYLNNRLMASSSGDWGHTDSKEYKYDSQGKIISYTSTHTGPSSATSTEDFALTYDANNRVIQEISASSKTISTYNSSGQKVRTEFYTGTNPNFTLEQYNLYGYSSTSTRNYSTLTQYDASNTLLVTINFTYDTKQNPQAALFPFDQLPTNNVTQETFVYPGNHSSVFTNTYTYTSNGFPLTVTAEGNGKTTTINYSYKNCK